MKKNKLYTAAEIASALKDKKGSIPKGTVVFWTGSEKSIPKGWEKVDRKKRVLKPGEAYCYEKGAGFISHSVAVPQKGWKIEKG